MNPTIPDRPSPTTPRGEPTSAGRRALERGAGLLQDHAPTGQFDVYVVGFHPALDDPQHQMEAHHYCNQVNDDFFQCLLFDGNTRAANLIGVEYIVSERLFETLDDQEQGYWHPHNYEILSGTLVAPGLPAAAEDRLMRVLLNSYGKTWHTWQSGRHDHDDGDDLPLGPPALMWSFNRDGQSDPALETGRDEALGVDSSEARERRQPLVDEARPQRGVARLDGRFPGSRPISGVTDRDAD